MWSFTYQGVLRWTVTGQYNVIPKFLSFFLIGDCDTTYDNFQDTSICAVGFTLQFKMADLQSRLNIN